MLDSFFFRRWREEERMMGECLRRMLLIFARFVLRLRSSMKPFLSFFSWFERERESEESETRRRASEDLDSIQRRRFLCVLIHRLRRHPARSPFGFSKPFHSCSGRPTTTNRERESDKVRKKKTELRGEISASSFHERKNLHKASTV